MPPREMNHLGEIAGGVVGRQQRELRSAGGRDPLDPAMQSLAWETVDGHVDRLARFHPGELGLLVVGDDIDIWQRHDIDQVASDIDVVARLHLTLADDAVEGRHDLGVAELEAGRRQRCLGALQIRCTLQLGAGEHLELVALCRDQRPARPDISLRAGVTRGGLLQLLPGAGFGLCQGLLPLLLLTGFNLLSGRGHLLRLGLRNGGVLQLHLIGEVVERRLCAGDAGLRLGDLGLVVGGIDLNQEIASLDALEIVRGDGKNFTGDPAAQPCQLGPDIGVVGGLDDGAADPGVPAQRRQHDESERGQHGEQRNREATPGMTWSGRRLRRWRIGWRSRSRRR